MHIVESLTPMREPQMFAKCDFSYEAFAPDIRRRDVLLGDAVTAAKAFNEADRDLLE